MQPKHDGRCDAVGREEKFATAIISSGDSAPVLEAREEVFDPVAVLLELTVVPGRVLEPTPCRVQAAIPLSLRA